MAYKVFTNGSVLNASEINENLMNQAVISFSSSTARAAAIPSPIEGMLTWLEDVNRYENYNGTAWVNTISTPGLEFISSTPIGTAVASVTVSNIFNSTYDNYRIHVTGGTNSVNGAQLRLQLSGTTGGTQYYGGGIQTLFSSGAVSSNWDNNISRFNNIGNNSEMYVNVYGPFLPRSTRVGAEFYTTVAAGNYNGYILNTNSDTGFTISTSSGTLTGGTIVVYGYRRI
jgi:hypothetical protein